MASRKKASHGYAAPPSPHPPLHCRKGRKGRSLSNVHRGFTILHLCGELEHQPMKKMLVTQCSMARTPRLWPTPAQEPISAAPFEEESGARVPSLGPHDIFFLAASGT